MPYLGRIFKSFCLKASFSRLKCQRQEPSAPAMHHFRFPFLLRTSSALRSAGKFAVIQACTFSGSRTPRR